MTSKEAILKLAKKYKSETGTYSELPEFWEDYSERVINYLASVLRRCSDLPKDLRPKR